MKKRNAIFLWELLIQEEFIYKLYTFIFFFLQNIKLTFELSSCNSSRSL